MKSCYVRRIDARVPVLRLRTTLNLHHQGQGRGDAPCQYLRSVGLHRYPILCAVGAFYAIAIFVIDRLDTKGVCVSVPFQLQCPEEPHEHEVRINPSELSHTDASLRADIQKVTIKSGLAARLHQ